jgi:hypothetical protein
MSNDAKKLHPVNARMKNLRLALGYPKPGKFAQMLGISISRWTNVEGGHPLTHAVAVILKSKIPGLSYDFIYDGDVEKLGDELRTVLGERPSKKSLPNLPLGPDFDKPAPNNDYRPASARSIKRIDGRLSGMARLSGHLAHPATVVGAVHPRHSDQIVDVFSHPFNFLGGLGIHRAVSDSPVNHPAQAGH